MKRGDLSCRFAIFVNCILNGIEVVTVEREYVVLNEEVVFRAMMNIWCMLYYL